MSHSITALIRSTLLCMPFAWVVTPTYAEVSANLPPVTDPILASAKPTPQATPIDDATLSSMRAIGSTTNIISTLPPAASAPTTLQISTVRLWDEVIPPAPTPKPQQVALSLPSVNAQSISNLRNPRQPSVTMGVGLTHH